MTASERSAALLKEADELLDSIRLREHCASIGEILPTGSYFLDLMMYPDVDLYLPMTTPENILAVAAQLSRLDCVKRIIFQRGMQGDLKDGLYLKPVVERGNWERPWKIDIWSLPESVIEEKQAVLIDFKRRMTAEHRHRILDFKLRLLTSKGRTPMFSGVHIYKAVIDHDVQDLDQIVLFLKENGIDV